MILNTYLVRQALFSQLHMLSNSYRVACLIRVPTEVIKQRTQASPSSSTRSVLLATLREEGVRGLYRGYGSTVLREVGFIHSFFLFNSLTLHTALCHFK
uniref:Mitochondrial S-adenosylmethionine carrier protein n=1 Tax=Gouania willdenowi TaxID=441366 RepID=A0A8C5D519_GOUWI